MVRSLLTLFAFAGWIVMLRVRREAAIHLGVILVMFPLAYCVVNWSARYRAPMEWVLVLLAAVSIARLLEVVFPTAWPRRRARPRVMRFQKPLAIASAMRRLA